MCVLFFCEWLSEWEWRAFWTVDKSRPKDMTLPVAMQHHQYACLSRGLCMPRQIHQGEWWKIICFTHNGDIIINQSFFSLHNWTQTEKCSGWKQPKTSACQVTKHFAYGVIHVWKLTDANGMLRLVFIGELVPFLIYSFIQHTSRTAHNTKLLVSISLSLSLGKSRNITNGLAT